MSEQQPPVTPPQNNDFMTTVKTKFNTLVNAPVPEEGKKPDNFMWLGILTTILCCLPAGLVSIYYASKVDVFWANGDQNSANQNSKQARLWGLAAIALGIVAIIIYLIAFSGGDDDVYVIY